MTARALGLFLVVMAVSAVMAVAGALSAEDAFACSCLERSAPQVIDEADAAFTGTVVEVRDAPGATSDLDRDIDIRFRVETVYKGELDEEVVVRTSRSDGTCGLGGAEPGMRLSLGLHGDERLWSSSSCDIFDRREVPVFLKPATLAQLQRPSAIAAWRDTAVWSAYDEGLGAYRLMAARGDAVHALPVEPSAIPFDADVGPDSAGEPAAVYSRCKTSTSASSALSLPPEEPDDRAAADCDLFIISLRGGQGERPIRNANSGGSEFNPTLWRGDVGWVRTYRGRTDEPFLYTRPLIAPRELGSERAPGAGDGHVEDLELYGRNLAVDLSYGGGSFGSRFHELRLADARNGSSRRVARVAQGKSGRDYVGLSMDAGRLAWYLSCTGDRAGCTANGGPFRQRISTGAYERVQDATELAGFTWTLGGSYRVTAQEPTVARTGPLAWWPSDTDPVR